MVNKHYERTSSQADKSELDATGKTVFDGIYTAPDPRPYCEAMQALDYAIPKHRTIGVRTNASKLRKIYVMVGCAMRTKMPTGRYLHGAHGAPYFDKTLNLLALGSEHSCC